MVSLPAIVVREVSIAYFFFCKMLSKAKRSAEIDREANPKRINNSKSSRLQHWKFWFLTNYEYAEGGLTFVKDVISHSEGGEENSESLSKVTMGHIITDIWGEKVKHVKRGPRGDRKPAYLNMKRTEGGISQSTGLTLEDISLPQAWTGECVAQGLYIFSRIEKLDFNDQRLILELLVKLPPSSQQTSYTIRSHSSTIDLGSVLNNYDSTTTPFAEQISRILLWLDNLPICLGFVLEKGEAISTLHPHTTGQLRDLTDPSKEPETIAFSNLCQVILTSRAAKYCPECNKLKTVNRKRQERFSNRQVISPKCNKRLLSRDELLDQLTQERMKRVSAEGRARYWRDKCNSVDDDEDLADIN